ncbi:uncharacterized protein TNCV_611151 [Trichonephila clavipes]|nr:uncharacterized protein TNCV_611151 [Trichonephila clavipes]
MTTKRHPKTIMQTTIKKVKFLTPKENPTTHRFIASELRMPSGTEKDIDKFERHINQSSSHTSKSAVVYLAKKESEAGIKCTPLDEIHVKSPDASPLDFCAFVLLKRALGKRQPKPLNGL